MKKNFSLKFTMHIFFNNRNRQLRTNIDNSTIHDLVNLQNILKK